MKNKDKNFKTTSFYLASFLCAKGLSLTSIDRTDNKRCKFVFLDSPQREALVEAFNFGQKDAPEVMLDIRNAIIAIKMLKDRLYQNKF